MSDLSYLHAVHPISPATRELCVRVGAERLKFHESMPHYKPWNRDSYTIGCVGEALVSYLCGLPWATDVGGADGGTDIGDCDVKAIPVDDAREEGMLRRLQDSKKWAIEYALVVVQRDLAAARYSGWTTGRLLSQAKTRDWGMGPTCFIMEPRLMPGLPPSLAPRKERRW